MHRFISTTTRLALLVGAVGFAAMGQRASAHTGSGNSCSITEDYATLELVSVVTNANHSTTHNWKVTSTYGHGLSGASFQIPNGSRPVSPRNTYQGQRNRFRVGVLSSSVGSVIGFTTIGQGIKNGQSERFAYTLPAGASMSGDVHVFLRSGVAVGMMKFNPARCQSANTADLELAGSVSKAAPLVGETVTLTLTLSNRGPSAGTGIEVAGRLPNGLEYVSHTVSRGTFDTATGKWTVASLGNGETATATVQARVTGHAGIALSVIAEIVKTTSHDPDSRPGNGVRSEDDIVCLTITPATCRTVTNADLRNAGTRVVGGVATLVVPAGACPIEVSFSSYSLPSGNIRPFDAQILFDNETATYGPGTYTIHVDLPECNFQSDIYTGAVLPTLNASYGHPGNRLIAYAYTQGQVCETPKIDLSLAKSVCGDTERGATLQHGIIKVGNTVTYCVKLENTSLVAATGVVVRDVLPEGIEFLQVNTEGASTTFDEATRTITWTIGDVAPGAKVRIDYGAKIIAAGTLTNVAEVFAADQPDVDSTPNNGIATEDDQASTTLEVPESCTEFGGFAIRNQGNSFITRANVTDTTTTATLVIPEGACPVTVSLTSYTLGGDGMSLSPSTQTSFDNVTGVYGPGTYALRVKLPGKAFQVDLYTGCPQFDIGTTDGHTPKGIIIFFGYRLANNDGRFVRNSADDVDGGLKLEAADVPDALALGQSYPNPSAGRATIPVAIDEATQARLDVFDMTGRRVATLLDESLAAGSYKVDFDGDGLPSGLYVYRLTTGERTLTGRMTLVK